MIFSKSWAVRRRPNYPLFVSPTEILNKKSTEREIALSNATTLYKRGALSAAVAISLGLSGQALGQFAAENPGEFGSLDTTRGGSPILYSQLDLASGNGAPDQDFEAANDSYDAEGADDFVVPNGIQWQIDEVATVGTTGTPGGATVNITFYTDAGGEPGTPVCSYTGVTPVDNAGSFDIVLPTACVLPPGSYWMAQQTDQEFATNGQHFWSNRTAASNNPAVWRNPGDGFGSGCTDWAPMAGTADGNPATGCGVGGGVNPDFLFEIRGVEVPLPPPVAVPVMNSWGWIALFGGLLAFAGFTMTRRERNNRA